MTREAKIDLGVLVVLLGVGIAYVVAMNDYAWEAARVPLIVATVFLGAIVIELLRAMVSWWRFHQAERPDADEVVTTSDVGLLQSLDATGALRLLVMVMWSGLTVGLLAWLGLVYGGAAALAAFLLFNREGPRLVVLVPLGLGVALWALGTFVLNLNVFRGLGI